MFRVLTFVFFAIVVLFAFTGPIAFLRQQWAVTLWRRLKMVLIAYIVVRVVLTIFVLARGGAEDIYGW